MNMVRTYRLLVLGLLTALVLAACGQASTGGSATSAPAEAPTQLPHNRRSCANGDGSANRDG